MAIIMTRSSTDTIKLAVRNLDRTNKKKHSSRIKINYISRVTLNFANCTEGHFHSHTVYLPIIIGIILQDSSLFLTRFLKGALYRIQILCRRYTFWSYPAGLTIADPPG